MRSGVAAAFVVDDGLEDEQRPAGRQGVVGLPLAAHFAQGQHLRQVQHAPLVEVVDQRGQGGVENMRISRNSLFLARPKAITTIG